MAIYYENSGEKTGAIRSKKPNELGIYDMSGNVWEWCWDWYNEDIAGTKTNPRGDISGSDRVLRGGAWSDFDDFCRWLSRSNYSPDLERFFYGFRIARTAL